MPTAYKVPLRCDHAKTNLRIVKSCVRLHLESASRIVNTLTVHFFEPLNLNNSTVDVAPSISQRHMSVAEHTHVNHCYCLMNWE